MTPDPPTPSHPVLRLIRIEAAWGIVAVGALGLAASITALWFSMRDVMDIGGTCADGGPFVVATPCPEGAALLAPLSFVVGLLCAFAMAIAVVRIDMTAAMLPLLAWPALFLSLGWNFAEYAVDPPAGADTAGWMACAVVFALLGLPGLALGWIAIRRTRGPHRTALLSVIGVAAGVGLMAGILLVRAVG